MEARSDQITGIFNIVQFMVSEVWEIVRKSGGCVDVDKWVGIGNPSICIRPKWFASLVLTSSRQAFEPQRDACAQFVVAPAACFHAFGMHAQCRNESDKRLGCPHVSTIY